MGSSLGPPKGPSGSFFDAAANTQFTIRSTPSGMVQQIEKKGLSSHYAVAYSIGSGAHGIGYLIQLRNHLFLSPLSYYPGRGWRLAPGYQNSNLVDFYRPVVPECLFCHAGAPQPVPETLNTYKNPPFAAEAITCERCHGPAEAHMRDPVPGSIINPAKLPPNARDSVCEQCHLMGAARIANPGKNLSDFRPGEDLEDTFTVYVFVSTLNPRAPAPFKVISQSQQLALSMCARMSGGRLWCGTCHDPHREPSNPVAYYRSRCLSCHGVSLLKTHPKPNENCIACHMPRLPVVNGNHTVFTDHSIAIYPLQQSGSHPPPKTTSADALVPWRNPPAAYQQRNLALAEIRVGRHMKSVPLLKDGLQRLLACWSKFSNDPATLAGLGQVLYAAEEYKEAEAVYAHLIQIQPGVAINYFQAGVVWEAAHDNSKAIGDLQKALELDPLLRLAYFQLSNTYHEAGDSEMVRQVFQRYLETFPGDINARLAEAANQ